MLKHLEILKYTGEEIKLHNSFNAEGDLGQGAARFILQKRQVEVLEKNWRKVRKDRGGGKQRNNNNVRYGEKVKRYS